MNPLVIFDMDGVLVDSEPVHIRIEQDIFRQLSLSIPLSDHYGFVGMSPRGMWGTVKERFGLRDEVDELVAMEAEIKARAFERLDLAAIDGVEDLIRALKADGCALAIASSSSKRLIDAIVTNLHFSGYFENRISAEQVERGKPHPDLFLAAARLCGRSPDQCVVIEDSYNGILAANAAGMTCVGYRNPHSGNQDLSSADLVIEAFGDSGNGMILDLVRSLGGRERDS